LEYWSASLQLDSTFQKTRSLSHRATRQAWNNRVVCIGYVPKRVEFAPSSSLWESSKKPAGCWMLDAGCWMLDAGCWMLDFEVGASKVWGQCSGFLRIGLNFDVGRIGW
jgi:hypothetical protein